MAKDVIGLMDYLKIDKASIVGWSDGGIIGLDIAMNYPDRLDRLFAYGANTNVAGLKPNIDKDPTFAKYIENAGKDYERLSKTPKEFEAFRHPDQPDVGDAARLQAGPARQDHVPCGDRRWRA